MFVVISDRAAGRNKYGELNGRENIGMNIAWDDPNLRVLLNKIHKERGIDLRDYKLKSVARRISGRLSARKVDSVQAYIKILDNDPNEYLKLLDAITINVTEFFRDTNVWTVLEKEIIPTVIETKKERHQRIVRCWSAGTSHGEEAYSLSILFGDILGPRNSDFLISIHGTDIDKDCLNKAKLGKYKAEYLKGVSPERLSKYFTFDNDGYVLKDSVRLLTKFKHHNMVTEKPLKYVDLIICRNVLIYFSKELQESIYIKLFEALSEKGFLVLGRTEGIWGEAKQLFRSVNSIERIYQKIGK